MELKLPPRLLALNGQSGSGKGTATDTVLHLYKEYNLKTLYINSGDLMREYALRPSYLGQKLGNMNNNAILTPGFIVEALITNEISSKWEEDQYIVLDGTPRYVAQCLYLKSWKDFGLIDEVQILEIIAAEERCFWRLFERTKIDKRLDLSVDGFPGVPDIEKIRRKLAWWHEQRPAIKEFAVKHKMYRCINNDGEINVFQQKIKKMLFN